VDLLAREAGMSRSGLSTRLTNLVGEFARRYLTQWRMQLARAQLQETPDSLGTGESPRVSIRSHFLQGIQASIWGTAGQFSPLFYGLD